MNEALRVGFIRIIDELSPEGEYRPIYPINDRVKAEPSKIIYLESPTRKFTYVLQKVEDK